MDTYRPAKDPKTVCKIDTRHCEECGNTDAEDMGRDGYTECCNERATDRHDCRNFHASR